MTMVDHPFSYRRPPTNWFKSSKIFNGDGIKKDNGNRDDSFKGHCTLPPFSLVYISMGWVPYRTVRLLNGMER